MKQQIRRQLNEAFPALVKGSLQNDIIRYGSLRELEPGQDLSTSGQGYAFLPLVLKGAVKIFRDNTKNKELLLYYIQAGQSCAFCIHSILQNKKNPIRAVAQEKSQLLLLPQNVVKSLLERHENFQKFLLDTLILRLNEVSSVIDSIAFLSMKERVVKYLLEQSSLTEKRILPISHKEIADDLASSREVISRVLKQIEKEGGIKLSRGRITILKLPKGKK